MVIVAQLVRAPVCGSGGRGFESHLSPIVGFCENGVPLLFFYNIGRPFKGQDQNQGSVRKSGGLGIKLS